LTYFEEITYLNPVVSILQCFFAVTFDPGIATEILQLDNLDCVLLLILVPKITLLVEYLICDITVVAIIVSRVLNVSPFIIVCQTVIASQSMKARECKVLICLTPG